MISLADEKKRIISSMYQVDAELAGLKRNSPKRASLARQKVMLLDELSRIKEQIASEWANSKATRDTSDYPLTNHAIVRWLERKHGINTAQLRTLILTPALQKAINSGLKFWSDGGVVFCISDGKVRTVIEQHLLPSDEAA